MHYQIGSWIYSSRCATSPRASDCPLTQSAYRYLPVTFEYQEHQLFSWIICISSAANQNPIDVHRVGKAMALPLQSRSLCYLRKSTTYFRNFLLLRIVFKRSVVFDHSQATRTKAYGVMPQMLHRVTKEARCILSK